MDFDTGVVTTLLYLRFAVNLIGIATGFVVIWGFLNSRPLGGMTAAFLATSVATSETGFLFAFKGVTPGIIFGLVSLPLLGVAIYAYYAKHLTGPWRLTDTLAAVLAHELNIVVLIVQSFQKVGFLHELAPTQTEAPFKVAQVAGLVALLVLGYFSIKRFQTRMSPVR